MRGSCIECSLECSNPPPLKDSSPDAMLLLVYLDNFPNMAIEKWVKDEGDIDGDQWNKALESVWLHSFNVTRRLSQLYIILRVHRTPIKLFTLWLHLDPLCVRCNRDNEDLMP